MGAAEPRNGEPECPSRICRSVEGSWKEDRGQYSPASIFQGSFDSIPACTMPRGPQRPREVSAWPQKVLAGPWGTREGAGASLWCWERHPEGATPGARARAAFRQPNSCRVCPGSAQDQSSELHSCLTSLYFLCIYFCVFILLTLKNAIRNHFPSK